MNNVFFLNMSNIKVKRGFVPTKRSYHKEYSYENFGINCWKATSKFQTELQDRITELLNNIPPPLPPQHKQSCDNL